MPLFSKEDILRLFGLLNEQMSAQSLKGELYLVGGAVMCLVYDALPSTKDVDALFKPTQKIREAAAKVAAKTGIKNNWLNDAVKEFLSQRGEYDVFLELSHLRVLVAKPEYLLAMKCLAMRIGEEFQDVDDIQYLIRYLNIRTYQECVDIITRYYQSDLFPQKTLYALQEIFDKQNI